MLLAGLIATACGGGNAGGLLTHKDLDSYPAALLEATLVREGDCLYATGGDGAGKWLPLWPSGFSLNGENLMKGGQQIATVGHRVKLGGGEFHDGDYDYLRGLMTVDIPAACRGDYWLVSEVVS